MQERALDILDETVSYFEVDPFGRRAIESADNDSFGVLVTNEISPRVCAVARMYKHPSMVAREFSDEVRLVYEIAEKDFSNLLKERYRGFPIEFYEQLQDLHDDGDAWTHSGLTAHGHLKVRAITCWIKETLPKSITLLAA